MPVNQSGPCPPPLNIVIPNFSQESLENLTDKLACKPPDNSAQHNIQYQHAKKDENECKCNNNS